MWQGTSGKTHRLRRGMRKDCTRKIAQFRLSPFLLATQQRFEGQKESLKAWATRRLRQFPAAAPIAVIHLIPMGR
jgi:hypothetical protein